MRQDIHGSKLELVGQVWEYHGYGRSDLYVVLGPADDGVDLRILRLEDGLEMSTVNHALRLSSDVWRRIT